MEMKTGGAAHHVVVVGAGIVGVCCAGWLQRKGFSVTLIERDGPGEATSFGNAGSLSPTAVMPVAMPGMMKQIPGWLLDPLGPLAVRWSYLPQSLPWLLRFLRCANPEQMWRSANALRPLLKPLFECYAPLLKNAKAQELIRREGIVYVYDSEAEFLASKPAENMRRKLGAVLEDLSAGDIQRFAPGLAGGFKWGTYAPENGYTVNPHRLTCAIAEQVVADGGRLVRAGVRDIEVRSGGGVVVRTTSEEFSSDAVVIAAGAWSHFLAARLGDRIPLETQRGYNVTVANPGVQPNRMLNWVQSRVFATPMEMGMRFAGTVEIAGLEAAPNWDRADRLLDLGKRMYPDMNTSSVSRWMGHRPCLPDSVPVIGPSPRAKGVFYAFGHGHVGMCGAPGTGRTIAELVAGETPQVDIAPFRPDRF
jgi:D-amino-acid dehydrogenase